MKLNSVALTLLKEGYEIIPLSPNTKIPPKNYKWQERTFTKKDVLKLKREYNWGIKLKGITVVDIDTKKGDGFKSFIEATGKDPRKLKSFKVKTPSGGLHIYYKGESEQRIGVVPNVDIKSRGGYVLAAGSVINGIAYERIEGPILALPKWIDKLKIEEKESTLTNLNATGSEGLIVFESGRNNAITSYIGTLWQAGTSLEGLKIEVHRFNREQCNPPLSTKEVNTSIASIVKRPRGDSRVYANAFNDFAAINPKEFTLHNVKAMDFETIVPTPWIIDGRYAKGFMTFLSANGGSGKSLLQIVDAISAATGKPLSGVEVKEKVNVWLHNCEDDMNMLMQRTQAAIMQHGIKQEELSGLYITSGREFRVILAEAQRDKCIINNDMVDMVVAMIKKHRIGLWLVDPLVHLHMLSENDNVHMNELCNTLTSITERTGCAIGIAHHMSKAGSARGASAIIDAARIAYKMETNNKTGVIEMSVVKNNLSPSNVKHFYKLVSVDFTLSNYPTIVEIIDEKPEQEKESELSALEDAIESILKECVVPRIHITPCINALKSSYPHVINLSDDKPMEDLENALTSSDVYRVMRDKKNVLRVAPLDTYGDEVLKKLESDLDNLIGSTNSIYFESAMKALGISDKNSDEFNRFNRGLRELEKFKIVKGGGDKKAKKAKGRRIERIA